MILSERKIRTEGLILFYNTRKMKKTEKNKRLKVIK